MATYRTLCRRCERYANIGWSYRRWYRVARSVIGRLADYRMNGAMTDNESVVRRIANREVTQDAYGTLCDLVAITSPRTSTKRNLRFAWGDFIGQLRPSDMIRSTRVALDHYYQTGEIRGPKTSRFARVLRGADNVVVVDTWMARALGMPDKKARNKATQELAERVIGHVARRREVSLSAAQAAVWSGFIRIYYNKGKVPIYRVEDLGFIRTKNPNVGLVQLSDVPF